MTTLQELNRDMIARDKEENGSYGLKLLRDIYRDHQKGVAKDDECPCHVTRSIHIFFKYITKNKLAAYVIHDNDLIPLRVSEAGYKLYVDGKDGYAVDCVKLLTATGKASHVLDSFVYALVATIYRRVGSTINGVPEIDEHRRQEIFRQLRPHFLARVI